ncbi:hypothetical protein B4135_1715 [Caldibacillus debilis]|uniref:Uncharacterized protein n=1 Tax=Caldibacillus debilis TaxID=301148 RepID=A0A150M9C2_9BACI|nr:hypothetical protein B4135_1715 [Caldibacillus debilis]
MLNPGRIRLAKRSRSELPFEKEALPVGVWRKGPSMKRGWGEGVPDAIGT